LARFAHWTTREIVATLADCAATIIGTGNMAERTFIIKTAGSLKNDRPCFETWQATRPPRLNSFDRWLVSLTARLCL
jgi:hypothetical protein